MIDQKNRRYLYGCSGQATVFLTIFPPVNLRKYKSQLMKGQVALYCRDELPAECRHGLRFPFRVQKEKPLSQSQVIGQLLDLVFGLSALVVKPDDLLRTLVIPVRGEDIIAVLRFSERAEVVDSANAGRPTGTARLFWPWPGWRCRPLSPYTRRVYLVSLPSYRQFTAISS